MSCHMPGASHRQAPMADRTHVRYPRAMGYFNPPVPWKEIERRLSDGRRTNVPDFANGGDSPAWSRKRQPFEAATERRRGTTPYAELHCHSNFSFLDGASHPE